MSNVTEPGASPLLFWLLRKYPDTPKSRAKEWIIAGRVSIEGTVIRKPHQLMPDPGDALILSPRHGATLACGSGLKIHPRVTLLYLDSALAVVNKGPGLISVPAIEGDLSALSILADFLTGKLRVGDRAAARGLPPLYRKMQPLPVHRLDQYTTGAFCMALNPAARQHLIEQLKEHTMKREYVAYVQGRAVAPKGTWRQWLQLSRDELRQHVISDTQGRAAGSDAVEAITHFEVIAEYPLGDKGFASKLRLRLETGRKHQIRVQAAHAGLPLIGDRTYHPGSREPDGMGWIDFPRQALHAEVLSLEHPEQPGVRMRWTAALPDDLRRLEATLRSGRRVRQ